MSMLHPDILHGGIPCQLYIGPLFFSNLNQQLSRDFIAGGCKLGLRRLYTLSRERVCLLDTNLEQTGPHRFHEFNKIVVCLLRSNNVVVCPKTLHISTRKHWLFSVYPRRTKELQVFRR
jgi:hypothetical protein